MIAIVVPTYNEKSNIQRLVQSICLSLKPLGLRFKIIIVDDSSSDGTGDIADRLAKKYPILVVHRTEKGRASAGIAGFKKALQLGADLIIEMDADFSHDPTHLPKLLQLSSRYDIVVGSRYVEGGSDSIRGYFRRILSRTSNKLTRWFLGLHLMDCTGGFKCYKAKVLRSLDFNNILSTGYSIGAEILYRAQKKGFTICETPITFIDRKKGQSKMKVQTILSFLFILLMLKLNGAHNKVERKHYDLFQRIINTAIVKEFGKFYAVGTTGVVVNLFLMWALTFFLHTAPIYGLLAGITAATTTNFLANSAWTFKERHIEPGGKRLTVSIFPRYLRYWLTSAPGIMLQVAVFLGLLAGFPNIGYLDSGLVAIASASLFNFIASRYWVFTTENVSKTVNIVDSIKGNGILCRISRRMTGTQAIMFVLALILFAAFTLRTFNNTTELNSYWIDEAEYSLRAIYIVEHSGSYDPYFLRDHPPLFMYALAGLYSIFGQEWYVGRLFVAVLGVANTYVFYLIGREMKDRRLGLIIAMIFAFAPISVFINRQVLLDTLTFLFTSISFLCLVKYHKTQRPVALVACALLAGLAINTKFTAVLIVVPLLIYFIKQRLITTKMGFLSIAVLLLVTLPIIAVMIPENFILFHLKKTGESVYFLGDTEIRLYNLAAMAMTAAWVNVGIIPAIMLFVWLWKKHGHMGIASIWKSIAKSRPIWLVLFVWLMVSLAFFSALQFMIAPYIYTIFIPLCPIIGLGIYKNWKTMKVVLAIFLFASTAYISFVSCRGPDQAVQYLKQNVSNNDTIAASESPYFHYSLRNNTVISANESVILYSNATYIALKTHDYDILTKNVTVNARLETNYHLVYKTNLTNFDVNFRIYRNNAKN